MSAAEIRNVTLSPARAEHLLGCFIDQPKPGSEQDSYSFNLAGWALGRSAAVQGIEVRFQDSVVQRAVVGETRPDIARAFPMNRAALGSGFRTQVNLVGVSPEFELTVMTVAEDEQRRPFGTISGTRSRLGLGNKGMLQPLLVTTLGRTGSTWFMRLLGQHDNIVTYRPFEFEPRAGMYWVGVFRALSDPKSYLQPVVTTEPVGQWWLGPETGEAPRSIPDPGVIACVGGTGVNALAAFCQGQLEQLYRAVAAAVGCPRPRYFAEKYLPDPFVRQM